MVNAEPVEDSGWSKVGNVLYDISAILISIADITTDVLVIYQYFDEGKKTFFIISLIILLLNYFCK